MNSKGFISLSLTGYIYLGLGAVILLLGLAVKVQSSRLESCKEEHRAFIAQTERLGLEAKAKAKQIEAQDKLKKEVADNELKKLRSANAEFKRLRDSNPGERRLPKPPAETRRPDLSCFDRTELERAYGELVKEVRGIADEGTEATLSLDTAKQWASQ